jgi:hypothetical protein
MVYGRYNELANGVCKPTYNWDAPSLGKCGFNLAKLAKNATNSPSRIWILSTMLGHFLGDED